MADGWFKEQWKQIRGHAKWRLIEAIFGGGIVATGYALLRAATTYWKVQIAIFAFSTLGFAVTFGLQKGISKNKRAPESPGASPFGTPQVSRVSHFLELASLGSNVQYRLKMRIEFRNDSKRSIAVRIGHYTPIRARVQQPFVLDVLQIRLGGKWLPDPNGLEQVAVLPGQQFRLWIAFDETKMSKPQAEELVGQLGYLTLIADEQPITIGL
jgi:hypothetical protein